jgi:putative SOS response-associated peptidase YedK
LFGLVPAWSPTPKVKFSTHNARLYSVEEKTKRGNPITEKPTWRDPFKKRHCLVPMTGFIEPIYSGEFAGKMVEFKPRADDVMLAAGLWEDWVSKESGETRSTFTVLTDNPVPDIERMGHDRTPIFLEGEKAIEWLKPESKPPAEWIQFLRSNPAKMSWVATVDRPMAPGWEKRV